MDEVYVKVVYRGEFPDWNKTEYTVKKRFNIVLKYNRPDVVDVRSLHTDNSWHGCEVTVEVDRNRGIEICRWLDVLDQDIKAAYREAVAYVAGGYNMTVEEKHRVWR